MHYVKNIFNNWGPVICKCILVAVLAGLAMGAGSGLSLEHYTQLNLPQLSMILGVFLWISSMVFAVYVTENMNRRRFKKFACVLVPHQATQTQRRVAANHNRRYMA